MKERVNMTINENEIRHHFDEKSGEFYFSIIDVIDSLGLSTDPRNYWKVLKNRLNKRDNKLVTECNQLKMKASDGKYYLTDVANSHIMLKIIELTSPSKVATFEEFFNRVEEESSTKNEGGISNQEKLSTVFFNDGEIEVDMYKEENHLFIKAMLAGVGPQDIFIGVDCKILTIKVNCVRQPASLDQGVNNGNEENYNYEELFWGKFSRIISLPYEVDIDRVEANSSYGMLTIKLSILDKSRTKIIKVES